MEDAAPIDVGEGDDAVLLIHGLTSSPYDLKPLAEALAQRGFRARGRLSVRPGVRTSSAAAPFDGDFDAISNVSSREGFYPNLFKQLNLMIEDAVQSYFKFH